jgi:hypothetical protein
VRRVTVEQVLDARLELVQVAGMLPLRFGVTQRGLQERMSRPTFMRSTRNMKCCSTFGPLTFWRVKCPDELSP